MADIELGSAEFENIDSYIDNTFEARTKPAMKYCAWIYPGAPATNAPDTYRKYKIDMLRVEYFTIEENGSLKLLTLDPNDLDSTANAFSEANVKDIKAHSTEQFVTVSAGITGMSIFVANKNTVKQAVNTLVSFVVKYKLTGIDIDFENFSSWSADDYSNFKKFILALGNGLQNMGKKLALCGPMWSSDFDKSPFEHWDYNDFTSLPIDYMSPMTYDYQYDFGGGAPVAPLSWLQSWAQNMLKMFNPDMLIMGIPSYGYSASPKEWNIKILTLDQIKRLNGYVGGKRDASSAEVMKVVGKNIIVSNDTVSMNAKRDILAKSGIKYVSVWHLGGNDWFS